MNNIFSSGFQGFGGQKPVKLGQVPMAGERKSTAVPMAGQAPAPTAPDASGKAIPLSRPKSTPGGSSFSDCPVCHK